MQTYAEKGIMGNHRLHLLIKFYRVANNKFVFIHFKTFMFSRQIIFHTFMLLSSVLIEHVFLLKVCVIQSAHLLLLLLLLRWDETTRGPIKTPASTWWRLDDTFDVLISPAGSFTTCWFHTVTSEGIAPTQTHTQTHSALKEAFDVLKEYFNYLSIHIENYNKGWSGSFIIWIRKGSIFYPKVFQTL